MASEISAQELLEAVERIFADLKRKGISTINVDEKGYILFELSDVLDVYGAPKPSLGDYDEDIKLIREEPKNLNVVSYNYIQAVSSLMQYLAVRQITTKGR